MHSADYHANGTIDIDGRVAMTTNPAALRDIGHGVRPEAEPDRVRLCRLGTRQLEDEIARGAWFTVPEEPKFVFDMDRASYGTRCRSAAPTRCDVYTDYKSPYAYLAKDPTYELERDFPVRLKWLPYVLDIPAFLGSARVDAMARP